MLRDGYLRRLQLADLREGAESPVDRFAQSVIELHATIFHAYETGW